MQSQDHLAAPLAGQDSREGPALSRPVTVAQQVSELQRKWVIVGAAWQDGNPLCDECGYCKTWMEPRPYGIGTASEAMSECTLGTRTGDRPESCPAYQQQISEAEEQA